MITAIFSLPYYYPNIGRVGTVKGTHEMIVTQYPYIVIYRVMEGDSEVQVLDIVHMAQDRSTE